MCKINGHSIFSYNWTMWGKAKKRWNSKNDTQIAIANSQKQAAETELKRVNEADKKDNAGVVGEMPTPVVPVETRGTGLNSQTKIGLNLT